MKNITEFAKKPKLIKVEINKPDIVEEYGSEIIFWIYDNIDINTYFDFFKSQTQEDGEKLNLILRRLIKNEQGEQAIADDHILPIDLTLASITAISEILGKSKTKPSTQEAGNQPT
jgi:hypothetical protein